MSSEISSVSVALEGRTYEVVIGEGLIADAARFIAPVLRAPRAVILADAAVYPLYGKALEASLKTHGIATHVVLIPSGEASKSFTELERICTELLDATLDRTTTLIALGGGVTGDLVGFAASIVLRGVPFIQVPTTLLAQVDSSVGGKTAINHPRGKNLIGSFYQPSLVLADSGVLSSLPARHLRAGYAEIIKYGLIMNVDFYRWCLRHGEEMLAGNQGYLQRAIQASCQMKAQIVAADERESNLRAILNFGHTFGHAIEAQSGYSELCYHGEAVALGMLMACALSEHLGMLDASVRHELAAHFKALGLPAKRSDTSCELPAEALIAHMQSDKKADAGGINFVVLNGVGRAVIKKAVATEAIARAIEEY